MVVPTPLRALALLALLTTCITAETFRLRLWPWTDCPNRLDRNPLECAPKPGEMESIYCCPDWVIKTIDHPCDCSGYIKPMSIGAPCSAVGGRDDGSGWLGVAPAPYYRCIMDDVLDFSIDSFSLVTEEKPPTIESNVELPPPKVRRAVGNDTVEADVPCGSTGPWDRKDTRV